MLMNAGGSGKLGEILAKVCAMCSDSGRGRILAYIGSSVFGGLNVPVLVSLMCENGLSSGVEGMYSGRETCGESSISS